MADLDLHDLSLPVRNQLGAAMEAKRGAAASGGDVIVVFARRLTDAVVHDAAALRAMTHGRVRAVMIQIIAGGNDTFTNHGHLPSVLDRG